MHKAALCLIALALGLASCSTDEPAAPTRVEGVVVAVDSTALDKVNSFTVKDGDDFYKVYIRLGVDYEFPLSHLQEHVQTAARVVVDVETTDGRLYAVTIADA